MYKEPELLESSLVKVNIPRQMILRYLNKENITRKERSKISQKLRQIEKAINQLQHTASIVVRILNK